jgi:hypothetical protein
MRTRVPVDFSDLRSEYIGILYEGLLDYELRRAGPTDPIVFLAVGDEPALPLDRLEAMDDAAIKGLVETFKVKNSITLMAANQTQAATLPSSFKNYSFALMHTSLRERSNDIVLGVYAHFTRFLTT